MRRILGCLIVLSLMVSCSNETPKPKPPVPPKLILKKVQEKKVIVQGVWVTVFSKEKVLYSKAAVLKLLAFCKENHLQEIYLQIFRAGESYYDSKMSKKDEYVRMTKTMGQDPVDFLLSEAKRNGVKVYAWVNVLSLAQNKNAPILNKYGKSVLTRDKKLRSSIKTEDCNDSDKFYLRDDQLFLEPGDERVSDYILNIVDDIIARYPSLSGLHLDYVRYPYPVPYIPDSRFIDYGISYGFGEKSLSRFKAEVGHDPSKEDVYDHDLYLLWDAWKRKQVTDLVARISARVREKASSWRLSCAVVAGIERAYSIAFQDWELWIQKKLVDYVVLMNYTRDSRLFYQITKAGLNQEDRQKIYVGLGVFVFKNTREFALTYSLAKELSPGGILFFSYDDYLSMHSKIMKEIQTVDIK
ncbi:MAG: family 10 glycosylhydrolase [Candidatus Omnitrophica bacterium]|nr:family 10 glycosylhydrolase [Candidatus Omnitrophota bacterium]